MKKPLNKMTRNLIILFSVIAAVYIGISISIGIVRHIKSLLIQARQVGGGADLILLMSLLFLGCVLYVLPVLVVAFLPFIYAIQTKTEPLPPKGGRFNQRLKPPKARLFILIHF